MLSLKEIIRTACQQAFVQAVPCPEGFEAAVTHATQPQFGHFQCNSAMPLAKSTKKNPREIAHAAAEALQAGDQQQLFARVEVAGPGFLNLWLSESAIASLANELLQQRDLGVAKAKHPQKVIVDFSGPNVAKEMHVGHLRSTIIGDSLARVMSELGHDVLRLNHVGDWGTAFGMLIAYLKEELPAVLDGSQPAGLSDLMAWYRASKKYFDDDADFQNRARAQVVALQSGEEEALRAWKLICDISYQAYSQIYQMLDIEITNRGESFYNPWLAEIVALLQEKSLLEESDGAQCVFLPGFTNKENQPLPMIVRKSDGGYNYSTTDLAALRHRTQTEKADRIVYVTDAGQGLHFQMIFDCAKLAGLYDPEKTRLDHVPFGLVLGSDGKKLKTRSGEIERLIDLLNEGIDKAYAIFDERHADWSDDEKKQAAQILGLAAVKYADLSNHRQSDYQFSYDKMLAFDGNTAAFVLYANVRAKSILRKLASEPVNGIQITEPAEMDLVLHLMGFVECLQIVADDLTPNRLTDYLYKTACLFNAFFRDCRVEGSVEQPHRLALVQWTELVLTKGLGLLGIKTLEKM